MVANARRSTGWRIPERARIEARLDETRLEMNRLAARLNAFSDACNITAALFEAAEQEFAKARRALDRQHRCFSRAFSRFINERLDRIRTIINVIWAGVTGTVIMAATIGINVFIDVINFGREFIRIAGEFVSHPAVRQELRILSGGFAIVVGAKLIFVTGGIAAPLIGVVVASYGINDVLSSGYGIFTGQDVNLLKDVLTNALGDKVGGAIYYAGRIVSYAATAMYGISKATAGFTAVPTATTTATTAISTTTGLISTVASIDGYFYNTWDFGGWFYNAQDKEWNDTWKWLYYVSKLSP